MLFIVVPSYNEATSIGRVIRGLFERGFTNVVVVDDGSTDDTTGVAEQAGAVVVRHLVNRGQGAALQTGDEYAYLHGAKTVVHFDADGQFNPDDISPALEALYAAQADALLGSRFLDGRSNVPFLKRHILLPLARWINFVFTGLLLSDVHNGFRILTRKALEQIHISHDGMAHNTEIVEEIRKAGLKHVEFPVQVTYHEYGQGVSGGVKIVGDLLFRRLFGK